MTLQKMSGKETENECLPDFLVGGKEMAVAACTCTNTSSKHLPEDATLVITIIIITSSACIIRLVTTT